MLLVTCWTIAQGWSHVFHQCSVQSLTEQNARADEDYFFYEGQGDELLMQLPGSGQMPSSPYNCVAPPSRYVPYAVSYARSRTYPQVGPSCVIDNHFQSLSNWMAIYSWTCDMWTDHWRIRAVQSNPFLFGQLKDGGGNHRYQLSK